ncbi:MAG: threonine/serine dehydratase, partial [Pseudomonadota bacterium]
TPLLNAPLLDAKIGRRIFIKAECLQKTGSFKYRGARSAISALTPEARARGILAYSSGNHAQGIACAANEMGARATIVMPKDAPLVKIENTRTYGGEVVLYDREMESREEIGESLAEHRGLSLIKPFDNEEVIAGQGTCGLEVAEQAAEHGVASARVLVCCGGGGLTSGIALALADRAPEMKVHPVEPKGFDDVARSLASGSVQSNERNSGSICDAILTPSPGKLTFPILKAHCGAGLVVDDVQAMQAMNTAYRYLKLVLEPGGAVALAAAMFLIEGEDDVIVVASGGNVDNDVFETALQQGESNASC